MNEFCNAHVGERTTARLEDRRVYLSARAEKGTLTPGLVAELTRVVAELERRVEAKPAPPTPARQE